MAVRLTTAHADGPDMRRLRMEFGLALSIGSEMTTGRLVVCGERGAIPRAPLSVRPHPSYPPSAGPQTIRGSHGRELRDPPVGRRPATEQAVVINT